MPVMLDERSVLPHPLRMLVRDQLGIFSWRSLRCVGGWAVDEHEEEDGSDVLLERESLGEGVVRDEGGVDDNANLRARRRGGEVGDGKGESDVGVDVGRGCFSDR